MTLRKEKATILAGEYEAVLSSNTGDTPKGHHKALSPRMIPIPGLDSTSEWAMMAGRRRYSMGVSGMSPRRPSNAQGKHGQRHSLPDLRHTADLRHFVVKAESSLHEQGERPKYKTTAAAVREAALHEIDGILKDCRYYRDITTPYQQRNERMQRYSTMLSPRGKFGIKFVESVGEMRVFSNKNQQLVEDVRSSYVSPSLIPQPPGSKALEMARRRKNADEVLMSIVDRGQDAIAVVRHTFVAWLMCMENLALQAWRLNIADEKSRSRSIVNVVFKHRTLIISILNWFYLSSIMRVLDTWRLKISRDETHKDQRRPALKTFNGREDDLVAARKFTRELIAAVDANGDGGLSMCELKATDLSQVEMFNKASRWILTSRRFQKYDIRGVGIIAKEDLVTAMDTFLKDYWKYDGVLW